MIVYRVSMTAASSRRAIDKLRKLIIVATLVVHIEIGASAQQQVRIFIDQQQNHVRVAHGRQTQRLDAVVDMHTPGYRVVEVCRHVLGRVQMPPRILTNKVLKRVSRCQQQTIRCRLTKQYN